MPSLPEVLEAVAKRGRASLQLVCWDLNARERDVGPQFERAIVDELLAPCHDAADPCGKRMYALTTVGQRTVDEASQIR